MRRFWKSSQPVVALGIGMRQQSLKVYSAMHLQILLSILFSNIVREIIQPYKAVVFLIC